MTVPGAIGGWMRLLEDHGTWPIERLLQPAIALAQEGFVVTPRVASDWARNAGKVVAHPGPGSISSRPAGRRGRATSCASRRWRRR